MKKGSVFYLQLALVLVLIMSTNLINYGCNRKKPEMITNRNVYTLGHLTAKPRNNIAKSEVIFGKQPLKSGAKRDGFIYVPKGYNTDKPAPLAVMLHGAGGEAEHGLHLLRQYADKENMILLAPASREVTWDIIAKDSFDADVIFIDQALSLVFSSYNIDTSKIAIGGFSDGASYALCLGLSNGNLFTHIIAFSPGFSYAAQKTGQPLVFISHGIADRILPISGCSRRIVPQLTKEGYNINYKEFDGEHEIPQSISESAVEWFIKQ